MRLILPIQFNRLLPARSLQHLKPHRLQQLVQQETTFQVVVNDQEPINGLPCLNSCHPKRDLLGRHIGPLHRLNPDLQPEGTPPADLASYRNLTAQKRCKFAADR